MIISRWSEQFGFSAFQPYFSFTWQGLYFTLVFCYENSAVNTRLEILILFYWCFCLHATEFIACGVFITDSALINCSHTILDNTTHTESDWKTWQEISEFLETIFDGASHSGQYFVRSNKPNWNKLHLIINRRTNVLKSYLVSLVTSWSRTQVLLWTWRARSKATQEYCSMPMRQWGGYGYNWKCE